MGPGFGGFTRQQTNPQRIKLQPNQQNRQNQQSNQQTSTQGGKRTNKEPTKEPNKQKFKPLTLFRATENFQLWCVQAGALFNLAVLKKSLAKLSPVAAASCHYRFLPAAFCKKQLVRHARRQLCAPETKQFEHASRSPGPKSRWGRNKPARGCSLKKTLNP